MGKKQSLMIKAIDSETNPLDMGKDQAKTWDHQRMELYRHPVEELIRGNMKSL